ncbi:MAG TPA: DedA family protein [Terriglobia bacterium]|nr:DedA family protein [Terriglobia bacterium]
MKEAALQWIVEHGYVGIFSLLTFGIVGLPVPDELLLTFSGYLVFNHTLRLVPTFLAAFLGSSCGITFSYLLGRIFDTYVIVKYGRVLHITQEKVDHVHAWFERRGRWILTVGYFVPGVRHLTGYIAGVSKLRPADFMLYAYSGAFCWAATFISLGYFLGEQWRSMETFYEGRLIVAGILVAVAVGTIVFLIARDLRGYR